MNRTTYPDLARYTLAPVPTAPLAEINTFDLRRLHEYVASVLADDAPSGDDPDTAPTPESAAV